MNTKIYNYEINNKEYLSVEIGTINAPKDKRYIQRKQGMFVANGSIKSLKALISQININCIIYYGVPNEYMDSILAEAIHNKKTVYIKNKDIYSEYVPIYEISDSIKYKFLDKKLDKKKAYEEMLAQRDFINKHRVIPQERKDKMRKYIKYYEMDMPTNEIEWVETFDNLAYYIRNKIPYSFDKNKYYICPECGELVLRGTEDIHLCYCEIEPKMTTLDRIINGER